jgi:hypothetical protein
MEAARRRVPDDFMFSVRCHKDLTHKYLLSPRQESYEIFHQSLRICSELRTEILVIQTPPSFNPDEKLKDIRDLFSSIDFGSIKLAWEIRGRIAQDTIDLMHDIGIIHCTDIAKEMPSTDSTQMLCDSQCFHDFFLGSTSFYSLPSQRHYTLHSSVRSIESHAHKQLKFSGQSTIGKDEVTGIFNVPEKFRVYFLIDFQGMFRHHIITTIRNGTEPILNVVT